MPVCIYDLKKISKSYAKTGFVLKDLDLNVSKAEALCIMGASGAGKSTLLHIMGALDKPDSGSVLYRGGNFRFFSSKEAAFFRRRKIGFVFQFHYLLNEFTALENILLPARIAKTPPKEAYDRAMGLMETLQITQRKDHFPSQLSGGEQQRAAIARALVNAPEVLLADEPVGNLDRENSLKIRELFFQLQSDFQLTLIAVSHDEDFAGAFPSVLHLQDGKIHA